MLFRPRELASWRTGPSTCLNFQSQSSIVASCSALKALTYENLCHRSKVNAKPDPPCWDEAMNYKISSAMKVPCKVEAMQQCLAEGYPIIFGLKLTQKFFSPPPSGFIPTPDPNDPQVRSLFSLIVRVSGFGVRVSGFGFRVLHFSDQSRVCSRQSTAYMRCSSSATTSARKCSLFATHGAPVGAWVVIAT